MQPEQERIPFTAVLKERRVDLDWISHNLIVFAPVATAGHCRFGRGALIVDTSPHHENEACSFAFFTQKEIACYADLDINRQIAAYDPHTEPVVILLHGERPPRSYCVRTMPDSP